MHSTFYRRCFQLVTAALLGYGLYKLLNPLFGMIGWAVVLAFILHPLQVQLTQRLRGRSSLSAGILTVLTPFLVLVPISVLGLVFAGQAARLLEYLRQHSSVFSSDQLLDRISGIPLIGRAVDWARADAVVSAQQVQGWITESVQSALKEAATMGGDVAIGVFGTLIGFFMMLFMLFFFLRDGRTIVTGLTRLVPAEPERRAQLLKYLGDVTRAVVFGSVATALIQGVIVGIGFAIVKLPSAVVWGVLATLAAFLPAGSSIVLIPAVVYLAFQGRWGATIFLACWVAVLWIAENLLRPLLTSQRVEVSTLALFIGAIGGAAAWGILGLFIGPVLLSFVVALVRFAQESRPANA
ncbi:MAG: AI-2E family transporter [Gammaproteobacteria bacterium]|nr:AI-2E family transporter [Gammaproteobacteria bacterium]MBV8402666.1 AI-2E family transporter [Gammaproteobacteria bacterium]